MAKSNNPQTIKVILAVIVLLVAGIILVNNSKRGSTSSGQYFYDLDASSLYVAKPGTLAPTTAPSGGVGVEAVVYACSTCDDPATHVITFLTKYTDTYLEVLRSGEPPTDEQMKTRRLIRTVENEKWLPDSSDAAKVIVSTEPNCPSDKPAVLCQP